MNRRDLLQKLGGAIALAGVVGVTTKEKVLAQGGNCTPPQQFTYTQTSYYYSQCSQQYIYYTVTIKQTVQMCTNADGSVTFKIHEQLHGTGQGYDPAMGQFTGTQYVLNDQLHDRQVSGPYTGSACYPFSNTSKEHLVLVSKGNAPNENTVLTSTYSIDSSCNVQSSYNIDTDCHG